VRERYNELRLKVESTADQFLVVSDAYDPRWRVFVDGTEQDLIKTNFYFRGVFLKAGSHEVHFTYLPKSFMVGLGITLLTFALLGYMSWREFFRKAVYE